MASDYRVADGHNVALVSLTVLSPQPRSPGVKYTRTQYAADGTPILDGAFVNLVWDIMASKTQYQNLLSTFGLSTATSNDVTVYVRNNNFDYVRYNGRAIKPQPGDGVEWQMGFPRSMTILVRNLQVST